VNNVSIFNTEACLKFDGGESVTDILSLLIVDKVGVPYLHGQCRR